MFAYVSFESEPGFAGGIIFAPSNSSRTERPDHTAWNASPASGGPIVPFLNVLPWQTAHSASNAVFPAVACADVYCGAAPATAGPAGFAGVAVVVRCGSTAEPVPSPTYVNARIDPRLVIARVVPPDIASASPPGSVAM